MLAFFYFVASNHEQIISSWKNLFLAIETVKYGISPLVVLKDAIYKILIFIIIITTFSLSAMFDVLFVGASREWLKTYIIEIQRQIKEIRASRGKTRENQNDNEDL